MDVKALQEKWRLKNAALKRAIAVPIEGVGTVYVRPIGVAESDYVAELQKTTDANGRDDALVMAWLLCDENGERLPAADREAWLDIFAEATRADYIAMLNAARGALKIEPGADAGN